MLPASLGVLLLLASDVLVAALNRRGVLLATVALALPRLVEAPRPARLVLALFTALAFIRSVDLARTPLEPFARRFLHLVAYVDTRRLLPRTPERARTLVHDAVPWLCAGALLFAIGVLVPRRLVGPLHWLVRWGSCIGFAVALFEVVARILPAAWALAGKQTPKLHDAPWRSRSLREFWGERWNLTIEAWLRENLYEPLRKPLGATGAMLVAFAGSAALHAYVVAMALSLHGTLLMTAFFAAQGALMLAERALHVERWPPRAGQAWAVGWMLVTAPLFLEPMLQIVEPWVG